MSEALSDRKKVLNQTDNQAIQWSDIPPEVREVVEAMKDKKVEDIRVYDLRAFTPFLDFVVLGTVYSSAQAKVVQGSVSVAMAEAGMKLWGVEGDTDSGWMLIDFWDVVVHLFRPEIRRYYNLEALWADLPWWPGEHDV